MRGQDGDVRGYSLVFAHQTLVQPPDTDDGAGSGAAPGGGAVLTPDKVWDSLLISELSRRIALI